MKFTEEMFRSAAVPKVIYCSGGSANQYKHRQHFISVTSCKEDLEWMEFFVSTVG